MLRHVPVPLPTGSGQEEPEVRVWRGSAPSSAAKTPSAHTHRCRECSMHHLCSLWPYNGSRLLRILANVECCIYYVTYYTNVTTDWDHDHICMLEYQWSAVGIQDLNVNSYLCAPTHPPGSTHLCVTTYVVDPWLSASYSLVY